MEGDEHFVAYISTLVADDRINLTTIITDVIFCEYHQ